MKPKIRAMLNEAEQALLRETEERNLTQLDEDALIELHRRVRRARTKYIKLHRRRGAAQVRKDRSRTRAKGAVSKTAVKAEAFEEALAVVSGRLATLAAEAAEALRQERLAAARGRKKKGKATPGSGKPAPPDRGEARDRSPIEQKRNAATRATTRRKQAKKARKADRAASR